MTYVPIYCRAEKGQGVISEFLLRQLNKIQEQSMNQRWEDYQK